MISSIRKNSQACHTDVIPQGFGEFGLVVTNPIPAFGIEGGYDYLERLRTVDGAKVQFGRIGSFQADNINMPIDQYVISSLEGELLIHLFISPYHWQTSGKAPRGLQLEAGGASGNPGNEPHEKLRPSHPWALAWGMVILILLIIIAILVYVVA